LPERTIFHAKAWRSSPTGRQRGMHASQQEKRHTAMFKQRKVRQASLIVFATTVILILPNLTRLVG
jgi:hypothetical protein